MALQPRFGSVRSVDVENTWRWETEIQTDVDPWSIAKSLLRVAVVMMILMV